MTNKGPKVLVFDIETSPILAHVWSIWEQNVGLVQIKDDWHLLSWAAKWLGDKEVMYQDQRGVRDIADDKKLLRGIWKLLDEADVVVTQNGRQFDQKKLNARFVIQGFQPPSSFKHIDTKILAKRHFGFTSNKLEYMTDKLCTKYKKLTHKKFPGFELWKECLAGNIEAWKEMELYNKHDVLALEELYQKLIPWDSSINFNLYRPIDGQHVCKCGSTELARNGYYFTTAGKFRRFKCKQCGAETREARNAFSKDDRELIKRGTVR